MELPERFEKMRMALAEKIAGKRESEALDEALPAAELPQNLAKADYDALSASVDAWLRWVGICTPQMRSTTAFMSKEALCCLCCKFQDNVFPALSPENIRTHDARPNLSTLLMRAQAIYEQSDDPGFIQQTLNRYVLGSFFPRKGRKEYATVLILCACPLVFGHLCREDNGIKTLILISQVTATPLIN